MLIPCDAGSLQDFQEDVIQISSKHMSWHLIKILAFETMVKREWC